MPAASNVGEREGLRIAKLFRKHRVGVDVRRCDLEQVAEEDEIEIVDSRLPNPGYAACLIRPPDGDPGGLIALQPGQGRGRRRFSLAHELGHFYIPRHKGVNGYCADRDMRARFRDAKRQEWEANDFTAELLMPRKLFFADARKLDVSIAAAGTLAAPDQYDVSVMAAAWRIVQTTSEAAAIVVSVDGRVEWIYPSDSFRLPLTERGQRLHTDTLAAAAFREQNSVPHPDQVDSSVWLDRGVDVRGTLLESTHFIVSLNQVVSLLWITDADDELGDEHD